MMLYYRLMLIFSSINTSVLNVSVASISTLNVSNITADNLSTGDLLFGNKLSYDGVTKTLDVNTTDTISREYFTNHKRSSL
jgi:hypothetical protein